MEPQVIPNDTPIYAEMAAAAEGCRMVFFAGLPAAGKSFFLQQQALLATRAGRKIHFLRWDAALAPFETDALLAKYPEIDRVTHPAIRKAAGLWSRLAVARWQADFPRKEELLIGEMPISGNRFVELAQVHQDAAEPLLAGNSAVFFVPVPTNEIRQELEARRRASIANPRHADEARDAPMSTMEDVMQETRALAVAIGLVDAQQAANAQSYDATIYSRFFQHLLRHRNCRVLKVEALYPGVVSAHDLDVAGTELMALRGEVADQISKLENCFNADEIIRSVETWHQV